MPGPGCQGRQQDSVAALVALCDADVNRYGRASDAIRTVELVS